MKKILFYVSLACVLATFSCSDNEEAPLPGTPGAITGANANDCPAVTVDLSIGAVTGATSYQWFKDGTAISGATVTTCTVTESGNYTVAGVNSNGTGPRSAAHAVIITECDDEPLPGDAGAITGANDNDCPDVTVDLSIAEIEGAVSYQWYKNETVITGATLITYTVTQSGTYTVAGVNASGTGTPSPDHVVTITSCGDESIEGAWSGWAYAAFDEEEVEWDEVIVQAGEGIFHLTNFLDWGDDLLYVLREDTDGYYVQNESSIGVHPEYGVVRQVMAGWDPIQDKKYVFTGEVYLEMELDGNTLKLEEEDTYDVGGTPTVLKHAIASMVTIDDLNYFLDFGVGVTYTKDGAKKSSSTTKKTKKSNRKQQVLQVGKEIETLKR